MAATDHRAQALRALERADHVRNADRYHGDRGEDAIYQVGVAHVHALLALEQRLDSILGWLETREWGKP